MRPRQSFTERAGAHELGFTARYGVEEILHVLPGQKVLTRIDEIAWRQRMIVLHSTTPSAWNPE
jgi:hypothetical protein